MKIAGYCCQCGQCCVKPAISAIHMLDGNSCKYLFVKNNIAFCEFMEGRKEPRRAYIYWSKYCRLYPRVSDLREPFEKCTYYLEGDR